MICSSSFSLYLSLSLPVTLPSSRSLTLSGTHMQLHVHAHTHTHTNMRSPLVHFLPLPLFLSFWHSMSVSILRRVRTNRHATHTSAHAFVHADGRNGGHKASLKTTFFFLRNVKVCTTHEALAVAAVQRIYLSFVPRSSSVLRLFLFLR